MGTNVEFSRKISSDKWVDYFKQANEHLSSEFLKICSFFFAIPSHNANIERIFSMMNAQWTDERNRLTVESIKNLLMVQYNFKQFDCVQFYNYSIENKKLLMEVRSQTKYN
jgi:hypothetical protein